MVVIVFEWIHVKRLDIFVLKETKGVDIESAVLEIK